MDFDWGGAPSIVVRDSCMHLRQGTIAFSPSDLTNFMESKFVSFMDRLYAYGDSRAIPDAADEGMDIIRQRGLDHERAFLASLKSSGTDVFEVESSSGTGLEQTRVAMTQGREYIYQAHLSAGKFFGICDFLVRVDGVPSSKLGSGYSYQPLDTKLALKPKPYFAIQLCCYAEMLAELQGIVPSRFEIVLGNGSTQSFRTQDYYYFYRQLKQQFMQLHDNFDASDYPEDVDLPSFCRWKELGENILEQRDDLSRVANIRRSQIVKLKRSGITTMTALAESSVDRIATMAQETFAALKQQASLQLRSKGLSKPLHEILPVQKDCRRGFKLLPPASEQDIWFDMEGYPHAVGGLEYLFGATYLETGSPKFFERWAHDETQERRAFEEFMDWVYGRFKNDPSMHIYHYAAYEQTALRRLMGKFATREFELDELLRHNVFVDLYTVVRQALRVGEPRYSIKNIEHIYRGRREGEVSTAMDSVVWYYTWLECRDGDTPQSSRILASIRDYNKEDCDSTYELCLWLRTLQEGQHDFGYVAPPEVTEREAEEDEASQLAERVLAVHGDGAIPTVLSQLLHFHKREEKPVWWGIFDKRSWTSEDFYADLECLAGLRATPRWAEVSGKSKLYEFSFDPDQETKIDKGDTVCFYVEDGSFCTMTVKEFDPETGKIALSSTKVVPPTTLDIVKKDLTGIPTIRKSIFELVSQYCEGSPLPRAIAQFLERGAPSILDHVEGQPIIKQPDKPLLPQVIDVVRRLDESTLCIQGPPGCGKTYTSAHAIVALLSEGKTIGVTSNSHKAIELLLNAIAEVAIAEGVSLNGAKIGKDSKDDTVPIFKHAGISYKTDPGDVFGNFSLIGGTAYAFSREEAIGSVDYLFVDEAGQVCIANLVGMARSARNIVLLGDQMQLDQPIRGAHPGESGLSTLQYYLEDYDAAPEDMGIFLSITRRLPPTLCDFISSAIYSDKLTNLPTTANRAIVNPSPKRIKIESGLVFEPVEHKGCVQASEEEALRIWELVEELRGCELNLEGERKPFVPEEHVLIVAPYNKQVRLLKQHLPGFEIGTVDKFQGKEKPVAIISMAESDLGESARGLDFLLSKNRLNVALSRAQVLAIVVANPSLPYVDCTSLKSMGLVNLFSRIVQHGTGAEESMTSALTNRNTLSELNSGAFTNTIVEPVIAEKSKNRVLIDALELPADVRLDQRVPKKLLIEQGARTAADRKLINEGIEELTWIAALKQTNIGVASYRDDEREYLEIAVLSVVLRAATRTARVREIIHRAVPYPVVLIARHAETSSISFAHKRWAPGRLGKVVVEEIRSADILHPMLPDAREAKFLQSLSLSSLPSANMHAMYQAMISRVIAFDAASVTGNFALPNTAGDSAHVEDQLAIYRELQAELKMLRSKASKEKQVNRRVELNIQIRRIEGEVAALTEALKSKSTL